MDQSVSVVIADREPLFRRGLASCLEGDHQITIAASVGTARAAYQAATALSPAIVIVGITLPDQPGFGPITELYLRLPDLKIIALADSASGDVVLTALSAGAATVIGKDVTEEHLLQIVRQLTQESQIFAGHQPWLPAATMRFANPARDLPAAGNGFAPVGLPLTCRELEILRQISNGMTNAEIGVVLGISPQTVKNHVTAILRKLAVSDRTQAVVLAMRRGWLAIHDAGIEPRPPAVTTTWSMSPRR